MDRWFWRGYYHDGTIISEGDNNPSTNNEWSSDHLDVSKLKALVLEPKREGLARIILHISPGDKFKRKWRHYLKMPGGKSTCHILSLQRNGKEFFTFIRPDGSIVISSNYWASDRDYGHVSVYLDVASGELGSDVLHSLEDGKTCKSFVLCKDGESYYNFFLPNGNLIISSNAEGYRLSI